MDELIKTFHIDWKLLIAQLVNFGIVLFVLYKFAIKPISKTMDKRTKEIEKSLNDAKKIEENLAKIGQEREATILSAKREAQEIIEKSRKQGQVHGQQIVEEAKGEVQTIISAAKEQIAQEKNQTLKEIKSEVGGLVVAAVTKILEKTSSKKIDEELVSEALREVKRG